MTSVNDRHTKKKDVMTDTKTDDKTSVDDRHTNTDLMASVNDGRTKKKDVMTAVRSGRRGPRRCPCPNA